MKQRNGLINSIRGEGKVAGKQATGERRYRSLTSSLVLWFLMLALLPLSIVSLIGYQQANKSLTSSAIDKLERIAIKDVGFIENWFTYRFMDINSQAEAKTNAELLESLSEGWLQSGQSLKDYVKSDDWALRVEISHDDLVSLTRRYDYVRDIILIDALGNALFTTAQQIDLGTNIVNGPYSGTRFAQAVRASLDIGGTQFSDFERYEPFSNEVTGFITAPMLDEQGGKLGVIAIQLNTDRVLKFLNRGGRGKLHQYLVDKQGVLRTPIGKNKQEVLIRKVELKRSQSRLKKQGEPTQSRRATTNRGVFEYIGPDGVAVIGLQLPVQLLNVDWLLISEVDQSEALRSASWLGRITLGLVLVTVVVVTMLAVFIARRITRPIVTLAKATRAVTEGRANQQVNIDVDNEIGQLAQAFNQMIISRGDYEAALEDKTRQTQQVLKDLEEQKFALDQHAIVAITDTQGVITFVNERFIEISGYSEEELIGQNHRVLNSGFHHDDFWRDMYHTISGGKVWHAEIRNLAKAGHVYWVDTTIVPFLDANGVPESYIAIRTEITERKKSEEALIRAKEGAEAAAQAKSEFLASMSHEIRTPMNGVLGMLGLLQNTDLTEDQRRKTNVAQSSAKALLTVINDILDFSKVDAGKLELEELDFDIRHLFDEFVESMALRVEEKGIELILDTVNVEASRVKGDPGRIRQILVNLVGNAIKFTQRGEIVVRARLKQIGAEESVLSCSVRDTGIGIPKEKQHALFEAFTQVDASTTREFGGTGLGLSIVRQLCELMGGSISVASEVGEGSCFEFIVLLKNSELTPMAVPFVNMEELSLLIVDDNSTNRMVLREQLERWGANVEEAVDGPTALALLKKRSGVTSRVARGEATSCRGSVPFDVVILDMQMPGMNGAELGRAIKSDEDLAETKLVMMTSMGHRGDAQYFADLGFSCYFSKPATTSDLFAALAVVSQGGDILQQASPLVTRHYLKTLETPRVDKTIWSERARLLLVEDHVVNQEVALGVLEGMGLRADIANNGVEALQVLNSATGSSAFSLVLMDCQMPEMDGYEATRNIRAGKAGERHQNIPIVAMTANAMIGDREKCLAAGMSDYLSKPLEPDELENMLCKWLQATVVPMTSTETKVKEHQGASKGEGDVLQDCLHQKHDRLIWDQRAALKRLGGKEKNLQKLVRLFYRDMPPQIQAVKQACLDEDLREVNHLAHTIKGVAANLSGLKLQQCASELEKSAKSADRTYVGVLVPKLVDAYEELTQTFLNSVKPDSKGRDVSALPVLSTDELVKILSNLSERLRAGDFIESETAKPLTAGHTDKAIQLLLDRLFEQIEQFDSVAASGTLDEVVSAAGLVLGIANDAVGGEGEGA